MVYAIEPYRNLTRKSFFQGASFLHLLAPEGLICPRPFASRHWAGNLGKSANQTLAVSIDSEPTQAQQRKNFPRKVSVREGVISLTNSMSSPLSGSISNDTVPSIDPSLVPPHILGNGAIFKLGVEGGNLAGGFEFFSLQIRKRPDEAALKLDLALLHLLLGRSKEAYQVQAQALETQHLFRVVGTLGQETKKRRRLLAFMAPGDFTNNAQLEFILDGADVALDVLYVVPGKPLPSAVPDHDVAFCAVNESEENNPILERLSRLLPQWPRPVINIPEKIAQLSRDKVSSLFHDDPPIYAPPVVRVEYGDLNRVGLGQVSLNSLLGGGIDFPVLVRPVGSHGGKDLEKMESPENLATYLARFESPTGPFFVSPFVDYRGADGLYRKYRIAVFEGNPFLCHMALSEHWMIHYVNVGMAEDAAKRAEEADAMETFDHDFAVRHQAAFASLYEQLGLDYFILDCGELLDGRLLLFETDIAMVIHAIDSQSVFPYKRGQMAKVFNAFCEMVDRASQWSPGLRQGHSQTL